MIRESMIENVSIHRFGIQIRILGDQDHKFAAISLIFASLPLARTDFQSLLTVSILGVKYTRKKGEQYHNLEILEKIRSVIPEQILQLNEDDKIKSLLGWFKNDFMGWTSKDPSPFPRYGEIFKIAEIRTGGCSEWSMLFGAMLHLLVYMIGLTPQLSHCQFILRDKNLRGYDCVVMTATTTNAISIAFFGFFLFTCC